MNGYKYVINPNSDFTDADGVKSQGRNAIGTQFGNPNPKANFNSHRVVSANNRIYDPSYGRDFATIAEWENSSIKAYYKNVNLRSEWKVRLNDPAVKEVLSFPPLP